MDLTPENKQPVSNSETKRQRNIRLLRILDENSLVNFSTPSSSAEDLLALKNLLNEFFIEAVLIPNGSGFPVQFINAQITIKGSSYLEELERKEKDLLAQIVPNKPADSEEKRQAQYQLPPANGDGRPKPEPFFDNIFKLLAGIAFVSWMVQEYILPHNKFFLFLAIVCGLADVFYLFAHKILPDKRWFKVLSWSLYCVCVWLIYRNPGESNVDQAVKNAKANILPAEAKNQTPEEVAAYYSRMAAARQWQPPELTNMATPYPNGQCIKIIFGGTTFVLPVTITTEEHPFVPMIFNGEPVFIPYTKSNRLYVKTLTMFGDSQQTVQLNNEWPVKIPPNWDRNFNSNEFEIVDENMLPVLQIRYDSPETIEIRGIFVAPNGAETVAFDYIQGAPPGEPITKFQPRKAWFKYPSKNHLGELAAEPSPAPTPTIIAIPQSDYIEGTHITQKQLSDYFPFGYGVFFFGQDKILRYEIFKNGLMDWKIDMDKVIIDPDFASGQVTWTIPSMSGSTDDSTQANKPNHKITDVVIDDFRGTLITPLKTGHGGRFGPYLGNNPTLYVLTIDDNQRTPVFAIGFRIPSPDEIHATNH